MERAQKTVKVFLDASTIVAAVISSSGGSFRILTEASIRGFHLLISRYAYHEAESTIQEKYPLLLERLYQITSFFEFNPEPPKKLIQKALKLIDFKDAPVLAAAIKESVDILITLDRKHFIDNPKLKDINFVILTPSDFIKKYFS